MTLNYVYWLASESKKFDDEQVRSIINRVNSSHNCESFQKEIPTIEDPALRDRMQRLFKEGCSQLKEREELKEAVPNFSNLLPSSSSYYDPCFGPPEHYLKDERQACVQRILEFKQNGGNLETLKKIVSVFYPTSDHKRLFEVIQDAEKQSKI